MDFFLQGDTQVSLNPCDLQLSGWGVVLLQKSEIAFCVYKVNKTDCAVETWNLCRCGFILELPESMGGCSAVPFIYSPSLIMPFFLFLLLFSDFDTAFAVMVYLALLIPLLSINGFASFIGYIFVCFLYLKI